METKKEIGFTRKYETAVAIIEQVKAMVVNTAEDHASANGKLSEIRALEKELDAEYKAHPVIVEAKRLQGIKGDLATMLENARKGLKNGPMLRYEMAEEDKRLAEERRLQLIAEAAAKAEYDRQQAERKLLWEIQEKVRKEAEAVQAKAKADQAKAKDAESLEAARQAFYEAQEATKRAAAEAEATRQAAIQAKQDQAQAIVPVVVVAKTAPAVARRTVPKFRIKDASALPRQYLMPNEVAIGGVIRSLRANHGIAGVEYYEEVA